MNEFIAKKTINRTAKSKKVAKKQENYKRYQRDKERKRKEKKREEERKWELYQSPNELFLGDVRWAKTKFGMFMERTGRIIDLNKLSYHMQRRGQTAWGELLKIHPELSGIDPEFGWVMFRSGWGKRPPLNQTQLRKMCVALQVPFWREMRTNEMRAMILLLEWKRGWLPDQEEGMDEV